jgi:hypothetical protein
MADEDYDKEAGGRDRRHGLRPSLCQAVPATPARKTDYD